MMRCLIVEDNPLNWMIMKKQVALLGLEVHICNNGIEALDYCKNHALAELILLDGYMPEMDGINFLKQLRQLPNGSIPFIVFCSSSLDVVDVSEALGEGAECHFPKPLTSEQIAYAIKQVEVRLEGLKQVAH